jgi:hypothetical protein
MDADAQSPIVAATGDQRLAPWWNICTSAVACMPGAAGCTLDNEVELRGGMVPPKIDVAM